MSAAAVITGLGIVSPVGLGVDRFHEALRSGASGIVAADGPVTLAARVAEVPARNFLAAALLRRMDRLSRMMNVAAAMAAEDAGLVRRAGEGAAPLVADPDRAPAEDVAVVAGSSLGNLAESAQFLERVFRKGPALANPMLFPNLVMNAAASQLAMAFGWRGPNLTVCAAEISGEAALDRAQGLIATGRAPAVVVVAGDELSAILLRALSDLRLLSPRGGERTWSSPFDRLANGPVPGEGAAAVVLEPAGVAASRAPRRYAQLDGVRRLFAGAAPTHAWPRDVTPLAFATRPDFVVASADSSPERDGLEHALLGELAAQGVPVTSIKAATGEYGSSGLASVVVAALALHDGWLPGLPALEQPVAASPSLRREPWSGAFARGAVLGTARGGAAALVEVSRA